MTRFDEKDFRKYIRYILDECMPGGRFALGSGNSVTNFMKIENFLIMLDEGRKYI
jgi:uroporphyrinogen decarboxylase